MAWFSLIILIITGCHPKGDSSIKLTLPVAKPEQIMIGYQWRKPMVQEITVPAQVRQGFYEPEHREIVVIKPGYWEKVDQQIKVKHQEELSNENITNVDHGVDISAMPYQR